MGTKCTKLFRITVKAPDDMPLDQAIYAAGAIYGIRGGYIHKFNSTTGVLISKRRFIESHCGPSTLCYCPIDSTIWCAAWNQTGWSGDTGSYPEEKRIYRINTADSLTTAGFVNLYWPTGPQYQMAEFYQGVKQLGYSAASGTACMYAQVDCDISSTDLLRINPLTYDAVGSFARHDLNLFSAGNNVVDIVTLGADIWVNNSLQQELYQCDPTTCADYGSLPAAPFAFQPLGFCYAALSFWVGMYDRYVCKTPVGGGAVTNYDVLVANSIVVRVRYDSVTDRVFTANSKSNSVSWFDPADPAGTMKYKTGFDYPIDIVFTGTKAFAVQGGSIPLVEIDTANPTGP